LKEKLLTPLYQTSIIPNRLLKLTLTEKCSSPPTSQKLLFSANTDHRKPKLVVTQTSTDHGGTASSRYSRK
ncbi:hypothetical protein ACQP3F_32230, partial [Escherichia coli]